MPVLMLEVINEQPDDNAPDHFCSLLIITIAAAVRSPNMPNTSEAKASNRFAEGKQRCFSDLAARCTEGCVLRRMRAAG